MVSTMCVHGPSLLVGVFLVHWQKVIGVNVHFFWGDYNLALRGAAPSNFICATTLYNCILSLTCGLRLALPHISSYYCNLLVVLKCTCVLARCSCIYEWSLVLPCDSALKRSVDFVLCSLCYVKSSCVSLLMEWMGVVSDVADTVASTDDVKGCQRNQPLTDDVKADSVGSTLRQSVLAAMPLHSAQLATLAVACQSPLALRQLIDSGIVSALCDSLFATCQQKLNDALNSNLLVSDTETDAARCGTTSSQADDPPVSDKHSGTQQV